MGLKINQSEAYVLTVRHMLKEYKQPPWTWDYDYPEDMIGRFFPEDINAIVGLDTAIAQHDRAKEKQNANQH